MDKEVYLGYLAHVVQYFTVGIGKYGYRNYFLKVLGPKMFDADLSKIRSAARHLYRAYVVSVHSSHGMMKLANDLSDDDLKAYMAGIIKLDEKYGLETAKVDISMDDKSVDKKISELQSSKTKAVLAELLPENSPKTKTRSGAAKTKTKSTAKKTVFKKPVLAKKSTKSTGGKKIVKPVMAKKTCREYNLTELKEMAKSKGHTGYSKLKKDDLCKLLKIK